MENSKAPTAELQAFTEGNRSVSECFVREMKNREVESPMWFLSCFAYPCVTDSSCFSSRPPPSVSLMN